MKVTLPTPPVIGEIPAHLIERLPEGDFGSVEFARAHEANPVLHELSQYVTRLACNAGFVVGNMTGLDIKTVKPSELHRFGEWHNDTSALVAAAPNPTEFLVGELVLDGEIRKEFRLENKWPSDSFFHRDLATGLDKLDDDQISSLGLSIWQPEPFGVVYKDYNAIHRSTRNQTDSPQRRMFYFRAAGKRKPTR